MDLCKMSNNKEYLIASHIQLAIYFYFENKL